MTASMRAMQEYLVVLWLAAKKRDAAFSPLCCREGADAIAVQTTVLSM